MLKLKEETVLKGISLSEGTSMARVCLFNQNRHNNLPVYTVDRSDIDNEKKRYKKASELAEQEIDDIIINVAKKIGLSESKIFEAQKMILKDITINDEIVEIIGEKQLNAEKAISLVYDKYEQKLANIDNEYISERASDIGEIKRRLLDILSNINPQFQCAGEEYCQRGKNRIVVAEELTPGLTVIIDTENINGFVTEHGGKFSHAAILARALGIPAVSGVNRIHSLISCGTEVLIDGNNGKVIIWPSPKTKEEYGECICDKEKEEKIVEPVPEIMIMSNINTVKDVDEAVRMEAEGIGLYRTEFEFIARGKMLSEDEQFEIYSDVLRKMKDKPVYFRALDIGGDKAVPFFELPKEENPYLGLRGTRFLLNRHEIFETQARALARSSKHGKVCLMYPMIIDTEQFLKLKSVFLDSVKDIDTGDIKHGVMFEVPSACLEADELLKHADFGSIGTNDLIQYTFAVDRNNEYVAYDYNPDRNSFWKLIKFVVDGAEKNNRTLSVCGEIASEIRYVKKLIEIGINQISVSSRLIPRLRTKIKNND